MSIPENFRQKQLYVFHELADRFQPKFGQSIGYGELAKAFDGDRTAFKMIFQHVLAVLWHSFYKKGQHMKDLVREEDIKWANLFLGYVPITYRICFREDNVNFLVLGEVLKYLYYHKYEAQDKGKEIVAKKDNSNYKEPIEILEQIVRPVYYSDPFYNTLEKWYHDQMDKLHHEQKILIEIKKAVHQIQSLE